MTTGSITKGQDKQFGRFAQDIFNRARKEVSLNKDAMQRLLANGGEVMKDVTSSFIKHSVADDKFGPLTSFRITVPKGYNHYTQLANFASYAKKEKFYFYNEAITDENFAKATLQLIPGKTYSVKIFENKEIVSSETCLAFLATQQAVLVGAQGLSLIRQLRMSQFPVDRWTISFDQKDALWSDAEGNCRVPCADRYSIDGWNLRLAYFDRDWFEGDCLLCVCDLGA